MSTDDRARMAGSSRRGRLVAGSALAIVLALAAWTLFGPDRVRRGRVSGVKLLGLDRPFPEAGRYPGDPYVGSLVCAECHPGESATHAGSGHARTMRPAGDRELARQLDGMNVEDPERPGVHWRYGYREGDLHVERTEGGRVEDLVIQYAFGSGHHATTFLTVVDPAFPEVLEHRLTYFAREQSMGLTPGHRAGVGMAGVGERGGALIGDDARNCFGCHTTQISSPPGRSIDASTMIPTVSCERCHGPGRAHVEAARRGAQAGSPELRLPFGPGRYSTDALLRLCGDCHRHPSKIDPSRIRPDNPNLARFQPVGLLQSRCLIESGGGLDCVTCHDPHARASSDHANYRAVCVSCHAEPDGGCPKAPSGDCIGCHMPRLDAGQHVLFTDHWIRATRPEMRQPPPPELRPDLRRLGR